MRESRRQRGHTTRRDALAALLGAAGWPALAQAPSEPADPGQPIRLIVPFAAGGPADIAARMVADELSKLLGQGIVVDNRPGAGGNMGAEAAAHAASDGRTLLWAQAATHGIDAGLYPRLGNDVLRHFTLLALLVNEPLVIVAHPGFAANDVPGLVASARARPGHVRFGSGGHGSPPHVAGELFGWLSESSLMHVPYTDNAAALTGVMSGHVDIVFDGISSVSGPIRSARLKALGVTGRKRTPLLPQAAPVADTLPDYEVTSWGGIAAPAATPSELIRRWASALTFIGAKPEVHQRFAALGMQWKQSPPFHRESPF
jgi:tripartite-type tricarboxylate transporter receptor subunit TctC